MKDETVKENFLQNIKAFLAYMGCILMSLAIMYYLNGTFGILLMVSLGCALVISAGMTLAVIHSVQIDIAVDKTSASKGDNLVCTVSSRKNIIIPAPIIEVYISCCERLSAEKNICQMSLAGKEPNTAEINLKTKYSGCASVGISYAYISDYLGIFRFRLKKAVMNKTLKISVYPDIPDVPVQTDFLRSSIIFSVNDNDDDEESNEQALSQTGIPGYDHREYHPGDPLKRINWKISSKRDIYMIRLDELPVTKGQVFFLDMPKKNEDESTLSVRDHVTEAMLAIFNMLVHEGLETTFFLSEKGSWNKFIIRTGLDIEAVQQRLAFYEPAEMKDPVPHEIINMNKTIFCFTTSTGQDPSSAEQIVSEIPNVILIYYKYAKLPKITSEMWSVSKNFELKKEK